MTSSTPTLVFDGECGLCRYLVDYARAVTGGRVRYAIFQEVASAYPEVTLAEFEGSIQLFEGDRRFQGAEAAFRCIAAQPRLSPWLWCYRTIPGFARASEWAYRLVSTHRPQVLAILRPLFGGRLEPAGYRCAAWLFPKLLACVFLMAFVSLVIQAPGLFGSEGILPVADFLLAVEESLGPERYWWLPSLFWLSASDAMLYWVTVVGMLGATLMLFHLAPTLGALLAYVAYLSLFHAGQTFMAFQWDLLLLECGVVAVVMARHTRLGIWLYRLLMFRFMLLSGVVKLASGDDTWQSLTALGYHFETQPLPTVLAWYVDKLPEAVLTVAVVATFVIELVLPFFIFGPRRLRAVAVFGFAALQVMILLTGSYNFFNILALILCLPLLDDRALARWPGGELDERRPRSRAARRGWGILGAVLVMLGMLHLQLGFHGGSAWTRQLAAWTSPLHAVNGYGLFAVMTTERLELVVEGSHDGRDWRAYELPFKPGDVSRPPRLATPHQPRLDWQLWFAALTSRDNVPWVNGLVVRMLMGSPSVMTLFSYDPFPDQPPTFLRIRVYRYEFTSADERRESGNWWRRTLLRDWYPQIQMTVHEAS